MERKPPSRHYLKAQDYKSRLSPDQRQWTSGQWRKYIGRISLTRELHEYESASDSTNTDEDLEEDYVFDGFVHPQYLEQTPLVNDMPRVMAMKVKLDGQRIARLRRAALARNVEELWMAGPFPLPTIPYIFDSFDPYAAMKTEELLSWLHQLYRHDDAHHGPLSGQPVEFRPSQRSGDLKARGIEIERSLEFTFCCACAGVFAYRFEKPGESRYESSSFAYIWPGIPPRIEYSAISYVWSDVKDMAVRCRSCRRVTVFPMQSATKFHEIMKLAGRNSFIWLDALSIDQHDHGDIATQVMAMGSIYKNASRVSVLLPAGDTEGFETLSFLGSIAKDLMKRAGQFVFNRSDSEEEAAAIAGSLESIHTDSTLVGDARQIYTPVNADRATADLCGDFFNGIDTLKSLTSKLKYWERAWTFQEWALAKDIDLAIENDPRAVKVVAVKSAIFSAASVLCQSLLSGHNAHLKCNLSKRSIVAKFNDVKRLMPLEDCILSHDEIDQKELELQTEHSHLACDQLLGLSTGLGVQSNQEKARLELMLDTFAQGDRKAKFDADLIACWASMCNVSYDYKKNDTLVAAIHKVKLGLRLMGIPIFDFIPSQRDGKIESKISRPSFFAFAKIHRMSNASDNLEFRGIPVLSGRADAVTHLEILLNQDLCRSFPRDGNFDVKSLRLVSAAHIAKSIELVDIPSTVQCLREILLSKQDWADERIGPIFREGLSDICESIERMLQSKDKQLLGSYRLVVFHISTIDLVDFQPVFARTWALCPISVNVNGLRVAREDLNGTLAVVERTGSSPSPLAYLNVTDNKSGTLLVRTDEQGLIHLLLDSPRLTSIQPGGAGEPKSTGDRVFECRVAVDRRSMACLHYGYHP